jgi:hypothetical protein
VTGLIPEFRLGLFSVTAGRRVRGDWKWVFYYPTCKFMAK